ncbi:MAG: pyruvate dehydrogenase (acetyl-transferring), homodimeric type [Gammaproteobacteria bacterium]|jgi:pyruvate dehydrogenase E1 component|nr:pyruvate dehydrogenase (acetyl-transferring), homodimeric type [Gammaproteobacteria bacterium]MDP6097343.1 pyruvate dehydrogenase (acetyl-transferring), homodimeric type [Gammaproteobacteria bacterium]MDP7455850.1 pyruvate dehydrogenase (acetyl-transferring), homodimeric type [Gammaproteobacteria bacterium]HJO11312.1 pyruvate dehydrogenase (acetyl-transferring), homodimeric type [Gammaproteobacteria bacterium]|tara:strand:- start:8775 stop:11459 length:2685 start_codon:yes stop_codon:yes gene_type:complete
MGKQKQDNNPEETREWLDALRSVIDAEGIERANYLLERMAAKASRTGLHTAYTSVNTPYKNTIAPQNEERMPGDVFMERQIRGIIRWNALAMVMRANVKNSSIGGHISTFSSAATLYDVGFNYFFRGPSEESEGDLIYFQGHSAPGIYARSYLEGRIEEEQLDKFRQEVDGGGLSSYPHPWLMPDYWQFPTVSMGLGPIQAIYQAHVMKYLSSRDLIDSGERKIWAFLGDGETDEPESLGAIAKAGREQLDNLIFVINCNLQRLDGPVRGNGKIIQELEGVFRGAGWNVIKVVWGRLWDPLFQADKDGILQERMDEAVDGDYQNYWTRGGAYTREHFFGKSPELLKMVEHLSDGDIMALNRGGHDPHKVYAAYAKATKPNGKPTVILAKTVKGYAFGSGAEAQNATHSVKKLDGKSLRRFRDRFGIPIKDEKLAEVPYYRPPENSLERKYMRQQRESLGGPVPQRRRQSYALPVASIDAFKATLQGSGERELSTTMAFVRMLSTLCKDKEIGHRLVPIVPDEARTFGMEGMFRQLGIYSSVGQLYDPADSNQLMYYKEDKKGQMLEEGISEPGAFSAWLAAATSYSVNNYPLIPFYIGYSMFGFQRVGDLSWAAGDSRARGFLIGATAGRTTLNGEGLQHQDGHSHVLASTIPNCVSYDPAFAYELAIIVQDGLRRMYEKMESVFYYITTMNENYIQPEMPAKCEADIIKGMYLLEDGASEEYKTKTKKEVRVRLLGSGTILREVRKAAAVLRVDYNVLVDVWSVTSFNELRKEALAVTRENMLNPARKQRLPFVTQALSTQQGPVIAATDYMKSYANQVRAYVPAAYRVLGTDGFGRSDSREKLRHFFEVDSKFVVLAALTELKSGKLISSKQITDFMTQNGIKKDKVNPITQ